MVGNFDTPPLLLRKKVPVFRQDRRRKTGRNRTETANRLKYILWYMFCIKIFIKINKKRCHHESCR